jgi:poly-beta-1,6-N-acetyl-D-glucosamine synthase
MAHHQIAISILTLPEFAFIFISGIYFLYFMWILFGWFGHKDYEENLSGEYIRVSVLIAARNEESNLPALLADLANQDYPAEFTEIIIIDDHSERDLRECSFIKHTHCRNLKVERLDGAHQGKKAALLQAANMSSSELLLFTDADCRVGQGWVRSFVNKYSGTQSGLIIGLVDYSDSTGLLPRFFRFESLAMVITGAGSAAMGHPTICNGANLAVRRDLYLQYANQINSKAFSGDDVFLLHAIKKSRNYNLSVNRLRKSLVQTSAPETAGQFINQRARWASKGIFYSDRDTLFLVSIIITTNLCILTAFILSIINGHWGVFAIPYGIKTTADCLVIGAGLLFFRGLKQIFLVPFFGLVYPLHVIISSILGVFRLYTWKERKEPGFIQLK